jgi:Delta7-sterol 5-desaturase
MEVANAKKSWHQGCDMTDFLVAVLAKFPAGYGAALMMNVIVYPTVFFLFWRFLAKRLAARKIQKGRDIKREQFVREIRNALFTMCVGAITSGFVIVLSERGHAKIYMDINAYPIWWAILTLPVMLIINDTVFYWVHRMLHHKAIYKFVHHEHHKSITVNPFSSMSFNVLEVVLLTVWIIPVAIYLPIYAPVLGLVQIYGLFDNIKGHLGFELFPKWFNRSPLRFLTTSTYHDMHHTKFRGNYALHFRFWDWVMKTQISDYEAVFEDRKALAENELSASA